MKNAFFIIILIFNYFIGDCQSYLGWTTTQVNFRQGPSTNYEIIESIQSGNQLFIFSLEIENDFYHVINIETNVEGFIHGSFVKIGDEVENNEEGMFEKSAKSTSTNPSVEIFNKTNLKLSLKFNDD